MVLAVGGSISEGLDRLGGRLIPHLLGLFAVILLVQVGTQSQLAAQSPDVIADVPLVTDAFVEELPLAVDLSLGAAWLVWLAGVVSFVAVSLLAFRALSERAGPGGEPTEGEGREREPLDAGALVGMILSGVAASMVGLFAVGIGLAALVVPGLVVATLFAFTHPYIATDRLGVVEAMGRSYELTKGHRIRVFAILAVTVLAFYAVTTVGALFAVAVGGIPVAAELVNVAFGAVGWLVALSILAAAFDRVEEHRAEREAKWEGIDDELLP
ncbi:hypothetical protein [Saliphagus infecundisoli]|uniref:DUF7847 domain-containing protein n=1 Tax=Saliphagus infecundisoli TaxID=1849069 RepID=A0ABD5QFS6_9EURY|nr:hypothetical protein [Saliphagus infecundisoli]